METNVISHFYNIVLIYIQLKSKCNFTWIFFFIYLTLFQSQVDMVMNFLLTHGTILYHQLLIRIMLKILIIQKISHSSNGTTSCCEWRDKHCALPLQEWKKYMVIFGEISHFTGSCFLSPKLYPWLHTLNFSSTSFAP